MIELLASLKDFYQYDFLLNALVGTLLLGITCGILSPLVVAKRYAFIGSAISHSTLLGIALSTGALSLTATLPTFFATFIITLILTLFLAYATYHQKLPSDVMIGVFFTTTMAFGILVHNHFSPDSSKIVGLLFGNILMIDKTALLLQLVIMIITLLIILIPFKKWIYFIYDQKGAETSGVNTRFLHYLFFALLTSIIISGLKLSGVLVINTLLLIPGLFGLKLGKNMPQVVIYSTTFSLLTATTGLILANFFNLPSGALMAAVQFLSLAIAFAPRFIKERSLFFFKS